jgi:HlyD family secretion protein
MHRLVITLLLPVSLIVVVGCQRHNAEKDSIRVAGNIEATTLEVSFRVPGRVRERLVDEGATVQAGQLLARLEGDDLQQEVNLRRADRQAAAAFLSELRAGSRQQEIARAEATLAAAEAEATRQKADFARQKTLLAREVIARREFEASRAATDAADAHVREAREALALVRQGPREEQIDQARARLQESEAALALASTRLGYTTLTAPLTGLVLAKHAEPGEQLAAGAPILTIADLASVWLRAYIPESELGRVKVGQKARITTDTWPDKRYEGTVSFIAQEAEFTPKNVQTEKERVKLVYRIKIDIPNHHRELKPGMPADAEIITN